MRFTTLEQWLRWQETLHPQAIDLGLERVSAVAQRLRLLSPSCPVITVAGTNGKGSSVALLEAIFRAAGYRVGAYTSPHLFRYNERIRLLGEPVTDALLCEAFARIDTARGELTLSYFEFGTLAALEIFSHFSLDVMLLEVGLGGRLDAVNIIDADVALVSSIGIDHVEWLGADRETIGREKAGIFRQQRPAISADPQPPASLREAAMEIDAHWSGRGQDFDYTLGESAWHWQGVRSEANLPFPALPGAHQLDNAAGVLKVLECLQVQLPVGRQALEAGLRGVRLAGRYQRLPGAVEQVLDVAHNPQGGMRLAQTLAEQVIAGRTRLVLGMLRDKDVRAFAQALLPVVDHWYLGGLDEARGMDIQTLYQSLQDLLPPDRLHLDRDVESAYQVAMAEAQVGDRVVVCGSFHTVARVVAVGATQSVQ